MTIAPSTPTTRLRLPDGRSIDLWVDDDAPGGTPLVFFHGTPGSGLPFADFLAAARERGLRTVSWSRPGYGASTRQAGRTVADVAADTAAVLGHLGAGQAYVAGHSGGGPHALACEALLPDRVLGTALIAGVAPWGAAGLDWLDGMGDENHVEFGAALRGGGELAAFLGPARETILAMSGADVAAMFGDLVDDVDRAALTGEYADFLAANMREGQRLGFDGWFDDDIAFTRPWGFEMGTIAGQVHVWQGAHDRMVPFAHGRWLAANLGDGCVHLHPEHGHLSIAVAGYAAILDALVTGT
ncbi:MAG TPA: alpha/beta hydrolase [Candidatus Binatia bacterium]|nr:alpha/beta hydrolase [Candidatus Binatia bacterium]